MNVAIVMTSQEKDLHPLVEEFLPKGVPVVRHVAERQFYHPDAMANRCINIAKGRTEALREAQLLKPDWYFFLDDDVVPPEGTIEKLMALNLSVVGGWIPARFSGFIGGRMIGAGVFEHFQEVLDYDIYPTDLISLGCTLVRASLIEGHIFNSGTDAMCLDTKGNVYLIADSGAFSRFLKRRNVIPYLYGGIVCQHLLGPIAARDN